jgi:predicted amidophosphoribosyltransferase
MAKRGLAVCYSCGKEIEYTHCSSRGAPPEDAQCKVLSGWLTVSEWKSMGSVDHYDFCSFSCLQKWVDSRTPRVPETFLKAFGED